MKRLKIILTVSFLVCFFSVNTNAQFKYGKIVNKEPGSTFLNDIVLNSTLNFDPLNVTKAIFNSPTLEHPYFHMIVPVKDFKGGTPTVSKISINGERPTLYHIYVDGQLRLSDRLSMHATNVKNIVIVIKYTWHNRSKYNIQIELEAPKIFNPSTPEDYVTQFTRHDVISPSNGGAPDGWKYALMYVVSENDGLDRQNEPLNLDLVVHADRVTDITKEVRVMKYNLENKVFEEIPSQTYNYQYYEGRGYDKKSTWGMPSISCNVFCLVDVPAHSQKIYAIFYGNPKAEKPTWESDLKISGDDLGAVIENDYWEVKHHEKSGQLHYYKLKDTQGHDVPLLSNTSSGSVHWNPDTYAENGKWGHTFSWDPPDEMHTITRGPLLYKITRSGRMPGYNPEMNVSVTYTYMAHTPYILMSSVMEVINPYGAQAIRNGEMVFDADIFDHYAWKSKTGERNYLRTLLNMDTGVESAAVIPMDTPWLCLYNGAGKFSIGAIHLQVYNYNRITGQPAMFRPRFFLYAHPQWGRPLTYFVRTLVYPFGHSGHGIRGPAMYIPEGNVYLEEAAYYPFILGKDDPFEPIEILNDKLRHPLEVRYGN
jgi:hypothetical protein